MKTKLIGLLAIMIAFGASAFTVKPTSSNFYEYTSGSLAKADIQNINNYVATSPNPCGGATNVCGVKLTTAHSLGATPVASEFSAEETNLWASQQDNAPQDDNIGMKN